MKKILSLILVFVTCLSLFPVDSMAKVNANAGELIKQYNNKYNELIQDLEKNKNNYDQEYIDNYKKALKEKYVIDRISPAPNKETIEAIRKELETIRQKNLKAEAELLGNQPKPQSTENIAITSYDPNLYSYYNRAAAANYMFKW